MSRIPAKNLLWITPLLLLSGCNSLSTQSSEPQKVRFSFAPGNNLTYEEKLTITREKDLGHLGAERDESASTTRISVAPGNTGWDLVAKPGPLTVKRDGELINDPLAKLLSRIVVTYKLKQDGAILDVRGFEEFAQALSTQVSPEVMAQLAPALNIEAMKNKAFSEWDARVGGLVGKEVIIGDTEVSQSEYILPNRTTLTFNITTHYAGIVPCGKNKGKCVRIEQSYDSKADNAEQLATDAAGNVIRMETQQAPQPATAADMPAAVSAAGTAAAALGTDSVPAPVNPVVADEMKPALAEAIPADLPAPPPKQDEPPAPAPTPVLAEDQSTIRGKVVRIVDPSTMLIYREENSRIISMNFNVPGKGAVPGTLTETRLYTYRYGDLEPLLSTEEAQQTEATPAPIRKPKETQLAPGSMLK